MALAGVIIGSIALVVAVAMALLNIFQMVWRKPNISVELGVDVIEGGRVLECKIWNKPILNRFLKRMNIKRMPVEDLTAMFDITEVGSGKILLPGHIPKIRSFSGIYAQRVSLPASWIHAGFGVVFEGDGKPVKLFKEDTNLVFGVGKYMVSISVIADGEGYKMKGFFEVSENAPYLYWIN